MIRLLALFAIALVAACAPHSKGGCVPLGESARQCLSPPAALAALGDSTRTVRVHRGLVDELWVVQVQARQESTVLVASDALGVPKFTLRHDADGLRVEPAAALPQAEAARLLSLFELAHAEPDALRAGLRGAELALDADGGKRWRELRVDGIAKARAEFDAKGVTLKVYAEGLEVRVDMLEDVAR